MANCQRFTLSRWGYPAPRRSDAYSGAIQLWSNYPVFICLAKVSIFTHTEYMYIYIYIHTQSTHTYAHITITHIYLLRLFSILSLLYLTLRHTHTHTHFLYMRLHISIHTFQAKCQCCTARTVEGMVHSGTPHPLVETSNSVENSGKTWDDHGKNPGI